MKGNVILSIIVLNSINVMCLVLTFRERKKKDNNKEITIN